ncbi:DMT family transporter [Fodinicurvata halophila]|uniref:DMT family transporter n=1 Tax=Fodinicurvata halophila TaxID=1419723 RepID=A0ABV8UP14_9PROT
MSEGSSSQAPEGDAPSAPAKRPRSPKRLPGQLFDMPYLLLLAATLCWAGNVVLGRAVYEFVPPVALGFMRWSLALLILLPFTWRRTLRDWRVIRRSLPAVLLLSVTGLAAFSTLVYVALNHTVALHGALLQSTIPVLIVLFSFLVFRDTMTPKQLVGVGLSIVGATIIVGQGNPLALLSIRFNPGDLILMVAFCCYALYSVFLRKRPQVHPLSFMTVIVALAALFLLPAFLLELSFGRQPQADLATLASVLYVACFASLLAYVCFNRGVELIGANRSGQFIHLIPVFGSLMAVVFLGERLHWYHGVGVVFTGVGVYLAAFRRVAEPRRSGKG